MLYALNKQRIGSIEDLRKALAAYYGRRFGVEIDPEAEAMLADPEFRAVLDDFDARAAHEHFDGKKWLSRKCNGDFDSQQNPKSC